MTSLLELSLANEPTLSSNHLGFQQLAPIGGHDRSLPQEATGEHHAPHTIHTGVCKCRGDCTSCVRHWPSHHSESEWWGINGQGTGTNWEAYRTPTKRPVNNQLESM